jgi:hypothetical protein
LIGFASAVLIQIHWQSQWHTVSRRTGKASGTRCTVGIIGIDDGEPPGVTQRDFSLFNETQDACIELQRTILVIHIDTCNDDVHGFAPSVQLWTIAGQWLLTVRRGATERH